MAEQRNSMLENQLRQQRTAVQAPANASRASLEIPPKADSSAWSSMLGLPRPDAALPPSLPRGTSKCSRVKRRSSWRSSRLQESRGVHQKEPHHPGGIGGSLASVAEETVGVIGQPSKDQMTREAFRRDPVLGREGSSAHHGHHGGGTGSFEGVYDGNAKHQDGGLPRQQQPYGDTEAETAGGRGLLGSLFSRSRGRSPSPPPDHGSLTSTPVIEAIARGVRQLQELQQRNLQEARGAESPGGTETVKARAASFAGIGEPWNQGRTTGLPRLDRGDLHRDEGLERKQWGLVGGSSSHGRRIVRQVAGSHAAGAPDDPAGERGLCGERKVDKGQCQGMSVASQRGAGGFAGT